MSGFAGKIMYFAVTKKTFVKKLYSTHVSYVVFLKRFIQWQTTENKIQQHDKRHKVCIKVMSILTEHMYELSMVVAKREMEVLTIDCFGN